MRSLSRAGVSSFLSLLHIHSWQAFVVAELSCISKRLLASSLVHCQDGSYSDFLNSFLDLILLCIKHICIFLQYTLRFSILVKGRRQRSPSMDILSLLRTLFQRFLQLFLHLTFLLTQSRNHCVYLFQFVLFYVQTNLTCYFLDSSWRQINVHSL